MKSSNINPEFIMIKFKIINEPLLDSRENREMFQRYSATIFHIEEQVS